MVKEQTEKKFGNWCKKKGYYNRKLQTGNDSGHRVSQDSDFIMANNKGVYLVECKECNGEYFDKQRFHQFYKLKLVKKKTNKIKCYLLINYVKHKTIILLNLSQYIKHLEKLEKGLIKKSRRRSFKVTDFNDKYKFTWKELEL